MTISRISRAISRAFAGSPLPGRVLVWLCASLCTAAHAESGLPFDVLVAVCASCHGDDSRTTVVPSWGRIAGQNRDYLVYALKLYRARGRSGANAGMMIPYAAVLSNREIERLADHYAALR